MYAREARIRKLEEQKNYNEKQKLDEYELNV